MLSLLKHVPPSLVGVNPSSSSHQCSKGFLPRLFSTFCLGSGIEAYWGEAKRCTFWPRLSPEAIDPILCLGCFKTGAIYTTFCLGSVRTEAIGDKYFFFNPVSQGLKLQQEILAGHRFHERCASSENPFVAPSISSYTILCGQYSNSQSSISCLFLSLKRSYESKPVPTKPRHK